MNALSVALQDDRFEDIDLTTLEHVEGGKKIKRGIVLFFMFQTESSFKRRIKLMQLISRNEVSLEKKLGTEGTGPYRGSRRASRTMKNTIDVLGSQHITEERSSVEKASTPRAGQRTL